MHFYLSELAVILRSVKTLYLIQSNVWIRKRKVGARVKETLWSINAEADGRTDAFSKERKVHSQSIASNRHFTCVVLSRRFKRLVERYICRIQRTSVRWEEIKSCSITRDTRSVYGHGKMFNRSWPFPSFSSLSMCTEWNSSLVRSEQLEMRPSQCGGSNRKKGSTQW